MKIRCNTIGENKKSEMQEHLTRLDGVIEMDYFPFFGETGAFFLDSRWDNALAATLLVLRLYASLRKIFEAVEATFLLVVFFAIYPSSFPLGWIYITMEHDKKSMTFPMVFYERHNTAQSNTKAPLRGLQ